MTTVQAAPSYTDTATGIPIYCDVELDDGTVVRPALVPIAQLKPHPHNPRQGDVGAIATGIRTNGFHGFVQVQRSTGYLIVGNHRTLAAGELGMVGLPRVLIDVDDETALRMLLEDNATSDRASYDERLLANLLIDVERDTTLGLQGTGYDRDDLDRILADLNAPLMPPEPESTTKLRAKAGQSWSIGAHVVHCASCPDDFDTAGMVGIIDPPFKEPRSRWHRWVIDPSIVFATNSSHLCGLTVPLRFERVGVRGGHNMINLGLTFKHCLIGQFGTDKYQAADSPLRCVPSVVEWDEHADEPYAKPVDLLVHHLHSWTAPGLDVFDPYAGSGAGLLAAHHTGRGSVSWEIDPERVDRILARAEAVVGVDAKLEKRATRKR